MTPEEQIVQLEQRIMQLETTLNALVYSDRYIYTKHIQMLDGRNIQTGTSTGTKIGTSTSDKIGFFNTTPAIQQATIADANGTLADATEKINAILVVLDVFGFTA
mgnify:CR=1